MKEIIRITVAFIFITSLPRNVKAQEYIEVTNEINFKTAFSNEIAKYNDTISNNLKQVGFIFAKFRIAADNTLDSVQFSAKQPRVLIYALKEVLNKIKIMQATPSSIGTVYVLPIFYDYQPQPKIIKSKEDYLSQVVIYDMAELLSDMTYNSNGFFNEGESQKNLWGIKCTFLPTVYVKRFIIYH